MRKQSMIERFVNKIEVAIDSCWEWTGSLSTNGYGFIWSGAENIRAHRFAYEYFKCEAIPEGLEIDHLCRNHKCVNPDHLEVVTRRENVMRGINPEILRQRMLSRTENGELYAQQLGRHGGWAITGKPRSRMGGSQ